jgi:hypothetical protein
MAQNWHNRSGTSLLKLSFMSLIRDPHNLKAAGSNPAPATNNAAIYHYEKNAIPGFPRMAYLVLVLLKDIAQEVFLAELNTVMTQNSISRCHMEVEVRSYEL